MGANKCERESESVKANQGQERTRTSENGVVHRRKLHVICKSYFEEAKTFNDLERL